MTATPRAGGLTSLVFPAYNPGPRVAETWHEVRRFLDAEAHGWEVLFVCDGCTDGTPGLLARLTAGDRRVRLLSHAPNRGKGFAVRRGLAEARGDWRVFADVDLAYGLAEVDRVARALRAGGEVVIASRRHRDSRVESPPRLRGYLIRRRLQSLVFNALTHLLLPLRQRDTQAGLKGMSASAANSLLPRLTCDGFGFDCELLTACGRLGIAVTEVPVCVRYDDAASTTDVRTVARILRELWHIRRAWRGVTPAAGVPRENREAA
jgi:dolichyl-phosphate beta-glucosyltransferase